MLLETPVETKRLLLRSAMKYLGSAALMEAGFSFLSSPFGRRLANDVFFRRASFPNPEIEGLPAINKKEETAR